MIQSLSALLGHLLGVNPYHIECLLSFAIPFAVAGILAVAFILHFEKELYK